jgi:hypothetical protein
MGCHYVVVPSPLTSLVRGAREQLLAVRPDDPRRCRLPQGNLALVQQGGARATIDAIAGQWSGEEEPSRAPIPLHLFSIPESIGDGGYTWAIRSLDADIGTVAIDVRSMSASASLEVSYSDPLLNAGQSGSADVAPDGKPIAVAGPVGDSYVVNTASIRLPDGVPRESGPGLQWIIADTSWGGDVQVYGCNGHGWSVVSGNDEDRCLVRRPNRIPFIVSQPHTQPMSVTIELATTTSPSEETKDDIGDETVDASPVLVLDVELAAAARIESIPAPIATATFIDCGSGAAEAEGTHLAGDTTSTTPMVGGRNENPLKHDAKVTAAEKELRRAKTSDGQVIKNYAMRAVDDAAIQNGTCRAYFDPQRLLGGKGQIYGPQALQVTVHHEGAGQDGTATWIISPDRAGEPVQLPVPQDDAHGSGVYQVVIKQATQSDVVYRKGVRTTGAPEGQFVARLRPRGPFGWSNGAFRSFVTIPLNITGLRFPASPRDLSRSSLPTNFSSASLQAGVLLGIERWNYDLGRNPWAVPIRALVGFNIVDLKQASFTPSFMIGLSMTVPLIDSPSQLGTSLALGGFYEVDLRDDHPFRTGNRFLVTFGLNLFSLFGAK